MRVTVFGASGGVGRLAVAEAARRGHQVVAVVRGRPMKHDLFPAGVDVRLCAVYEGIRVADAVAGADAVISCLGIRRRWPLNPWSALCSPEDTASRCTGHILRAMELTGVRHIACISAAGVGKSFDRVATPMRWLIRHSNLRPAYDDLERMERRLAESSTQWLALRPTTLTNGRSAGRARATEQYGLFSRISRAAVARMLVDFADGSGGALRGCCMVTG